MIEVTLYCKLYVFCLPVYWLTIFFYFQDPAGIFELIEVVGNGTYGQVYKVRKFISYFVILYRFNSS